MQCPASQKTSDLCSSVTARSKTKLLYHLYNIHHYQNQYIVLIYVYTYIYIYIYIYFKTQAVKSNVDKQRVVHNRLANILTSGIAAALKGGHQKPNARSRAHAHHTRRAVASCSIYILYIYMYIYLYINIYIYIHSCRKWDPRKPRAHFQMHINVMVTFIKLHAMLLKNCIKCKYVIQINYAL